MQRYNLTMQCFLFSWSFKSSSSTLRSRCTCSWFTCCGVRRILTVCCNSFCFLQSIFNGLYITCIRAHEGRICEWPAGNSMARLACNAERARRQRMWYFFCVFILCTLHNWLYIHCIPTSSIVHPIFRVTFHYLPQKRKPVSVPPVLFFFVAPAQNDTRRSLWGQENRDPI